MAERADRAQTAAQQRPVCGEITSFTFNAITAGGDKGTRRGMERLRDGGSPDVTALAQKQAA